MEYYLAIKNGWNTDSCYKMDEPQKHYAKGSQTNTPGHMLYDSVDMKCPEEAKP